MTRGKSILALSLLILIMVLGIVKYSNYKKSEATKAPQTKAGGKFGAMTVSGFVTAYSTLDNNITSNGSVLASDEIQLQTEVAGRITYLNIQEGAFVNKGTLLVKLNDQDLQAQLKKSIAQQKIAQSNERRLAELLKVNGVSQQEYDNAMNTLNNTAADIELIQSQIAKTELRAPFSGRIGLRNVSVGAYISPSTIIASLQNLSVLKVDFNLPEKYAYVIKVGDIINGNMDGVAKNFSAKVVAIEPSISETTRNIKVRAQLLEGNKDIIPGAFVKLSLKLAQQNNSILIPANAIIPGAKNQKVIKSDHGIASFVVVETGIRTESQIEIISGLGINDTIVTSGILQVKPNMTLKFSKIESNLNK